MNLIQLNQWKLLCSLPYQADFSTHMQQGVELPDQLNWIDATVPGSVYEDLQRCGIIADPYYKQNSLNCEWVANRWWSYKTTFNITNDDLLNTIKLCFKGIDYSAQIYLNGHKLGHHEGMYLPFEAIINDYLLTDCENVLVCIIEHAPFCDAQPGYTSTTKFMKARYNYKWDFATRLVNLGLYDDVIISKHNVSSISHSYVHTEKCNEDFDVFVELELDGYIDDTVTIDVCISCKGDILSDVNDNFLIKKGYNKVSISTKALNPKLWWPNGYGEQNLYDISIDVKHNNVISDTVVHKIGFKTIEYIHADPRDDALPYSVVINGKRIFLKGTNIVPFCHLLGSVKYDVLHSKLISAKECNINFLRIWGGGHIESEAFYNICDELGLMVMQEFTMSSSGCDDVPSKNSHFTDLLHKVAVHNVKLKRNHTCLAFWSGGNELTDERYLNTPDHEGHPATFEDKTLSMLKGIVDTLSPNIMMLPCSASGPNALIKIGDIGNNHDVHGPWGFRGIQDHYTLYNNSDSILHGEFGCGGISNYHTLAKFLPNEDLKLFTSSENQTWRHHSGGWDSYNIREMTMFGNLRHIPFVEYIKVNQFVQAEALRYALEANRRRQWRCVGEMTWQFNEPWPNIQCSNVLDYYGDKKLAYYFMRDAYASVLTSLKYDSLFYSKGDIFNSELYIINDKADCDFSIKCEIVTTSGDSIHCETYTGVALEDISIKVCDISVQLPSDITGGFSIKLHTTCGEFNNQKEYLMLIADKLIEITFDNTEVLTQQTFPNRNLANKIDGLRADYIPVVEYYNRHFTE